MTYKDRYVSYAVKPSRRDVDCDLAERNMVKKVQRTAEKLFIEKQYWAQCGVEWKLLLKEDLNPVLIDNIRRAVVYYSPESVHDNISRVQHLNFDTSLENSFESILELTNQTKVAFGVVGTEDAYDKIFAGNLRQSRRLGPEIHADKYCNNRTLFNHIVKRLFSYQWFDSIVTPTEDILEAMYECTHGIIDQVVGVYMFMNMDYVRAKKKPIVNAEYVKSIAERHYPGMQSLLSDLNSSEVERKHAELVELANKEMQNLVDEEKSKSAEMAALRALEDDSLERMVMLKQYVVSRIMEVNDAYNADTIESICNKVMQSKAGQALVSDNNQVKLTQLVNKKLLESTKTDRRGKTKKTKLTPSMIKSHLLDAE